MAGLELLHCSLRPRIDATVGEHRHSGYEFHYLVSGRGNFSFGGRRIAVQAGDFFYTAPGVPHRMEIPRRQQPVLQFICWVRIGGQRLATDLRERLGEGGVAALGTGHDILFRSLADDIDSGEAYRVRSATARFVGFLYQVLDRARGAAPPAAVRVMRELLHGEPLRDWTLAELARAAGIDPSYANRLFRRHCGAPPLRYLRQLRMERAAALLRSGGLSVREVADQTGFADPYHFSRVFRRWAGMPPSSYAAAQGSVLIAGGDATPAPPRGSGDRSRR